MHKNDIVIKKVDVQYQQKELNQEGNEQPDEATVVCSLIIIVNFEEVTIQLLVAHVHNHYEEKVEAGAETIPGNQFAELHWEAKDPSVCYMINAHQKHK